jgi:hypothetical protein
VTDLRINTQTDQQEALLQALLESTPIFKCVESNREQFPTFSDKGFCHSSNSQHVLIKHALVVGD